MEVQRSTQHSCVTEGCSTLCMVSVREAFQQGCRTRLAGAAMPLALWRVPLLLCCWRCGMLQPAPCACRSRCRLDLEPGAVCGLQVTCAQPPSRNRHPWALVKCRPKGGYSEDKMDWRHDVKFAGMDHETGAFDKEFRKTHTQAHLSFFKMIRWVSKRGAVQIGWSLGSQKAIGARRPLHNGSEQAAAAASAAAAA